MLPLAEKGPEGTKVSQGQPVGYGAEWIRRILTRAKPVHMDLVTTGVESLAVELIAIGSHRQGGDDILSLRVGTSQIEDDSFGRTSVADIEFGDLNVGVGLAQIETLGAQGVGRQRLGYHTQAQEGPDGLSHCRSLVKMNGAQEYRRTKKSVRCPRGKEGVVGSVSIA